jgi:hypothetical protein
VTACCDIDVITFGHTACAAGPPRRIDDDCIEGGIEHLEVSRPVIVDPLRGQQLRLEMAFRARIGASVLTPNRIVNITNV